MRGSRAPRFPLAAGGVLLGLVLAAAPSSRTQAQAMAVEMVVHPNGLSLALPPNLRATRTAEGFIVEAGPPQDLRIRVALTPLPPEPQPAREIDVEGQRWNYALSAAAAGGSAVTLTACRRALGQWACLWQTHLTQRGDQDFELWTVARGLRAGS